MQAVFGCIVLNPGDVPIVKYCSGGDRWDSLVGELRTIHADATLVPFELPDGGRVWAYSEREFELTRIH